MTSAGHPVTSLTCLRFGIGGLFAALLLLWAVMVVFEIVAIVENFEDDVSFDFTFWVNTSGTGQSHHGSDPYRSSSLVGAAR